MIFRLPVIYKFIMIFSFCISLISILAQIFGNITPCQLCLISRYTFLSIAIFSILANYYRFYKFILIILVFGLCLFSLYHLGVENHWWQGPQSCISELPSLASLPVIDKFVESNQVFCDRANWMIFGISSTLWSFLVSAFLLWVTSVAYILDYYLKRLDD